MGAGDDGLGREVGGLLRGSALTVHRRGADRLREPGREHGVAAYVQALGPDLHDAAHDDVLDQGGVEVVALHQGLQRLRGQVSRVPSRQLAVALSSGGADGIHDDGAGHGLLASSAAPPD